MSALGRCLATVPRQQTRPQGGSVTGSNTSREAAPRAGGEEPVEEARLRAALARSPDDFDTRLDLARLLVTRRDLMGAWNETQYVLQRAPNHPRVLAYQALVRLAMGDGDKAVSLLKRALAADPDLLEAHQHLVFAFASLGRTKEAEAAIAEADRRFPGAGTELHHALARFRQELGAPQPENANSPRASVDSSGDGAPRAPSQRPATGERSISGIIETDDAVRARITPRSAIFVTVREAGVDQGPPAAMKRLAPSGFPLPFVVGMADSIKGQPLPERIRVDVRLDSDGDLMTRSASDPAAHADGVRAGSTGLRLRLR